MRDRRHALDLALKTLERCIARQSLRPFVYCEATPPLHRRSSHESIAPLLYGLGGARDRRVVAHRRCPLARGGGIYIGLGRPAFYSVGYRSYGYGWGGAYPGVYGSYYNAYPGYYGVAPAYYGGYYNAYPTHVHYYGGCGW